VGRIPITILWVLASGGVVGWLGGVPRPATGCLWRRASEIRSSPGFVTRLSICWRKYSRSSSAGHGVERVIGALLDNPVDPVDELRLVGVGYAEEGGRSFDRDLHGVFPSGVTGSIVL
jgi:hypothetical protein